MRVQFTLDLGEHVNTSQDIVVNNRRGEYTFPLKSLFICKINKLQPVRRAENIDSMCRLFVASEITRPILWPDVLKHPR